MKIKYYTRGEELTGFDIALNKGTSIIDELKIPSVVDGTPISHISTTLREAFFKLKGKGISEIKNVLIEEGISSISIRAFANIDIKIDNVCWPASCTVIPDYCFFNSHIESITGIDFVTIIGEYAFALSYVQTFSWPQTCKAIPGYCFYASYIESLIGVEEVEVIGESAFGCSNLLKFAWPPKCQNIPNDCFRECDCLEQIEGIEEVTDIGYGAFRSSAIKKFLWPAGVSAAETSEFLGGCEHLEEIFFEGTGIKTVDLEKFFSSKNIKKIDLSGCSAVNLINCSSPEGRELRDKVVLPPYYVTEIN